VKRDWVPTAMWLFVAAIFVAAYMKG